MDEGTSGRGRWSGRFRRPRRGAEPSLPPGVRPIEQIAADLRRMLWRHDVLARSKDIAVPGRQLLALEGRDEHSGHAGGARARCVPPGPPVYGGFETSQLAALLRALRAEGLVLPAEVPLMAPDSQLG